ncbi:hypothetical protein GCM10009712_28050 [Pseudarthrobacter sulfonivorans]
MDPLDRENLSSGSDLGLGRCLPTGRLLEEEEQCDPDYRPAGKKLNEEVGT